jgi:uncharacterized protein YukE
MSQETMLMGERILELENEVSSWKNRANRLEEALRDLMTNVSVAYNYFNHAFERLDIPEGSTCL